MITNYYNDNSIAVPLSLFPPSLSPPLSRYRALSIKVATLNYSAM